MSIFGSLGNFRGLAIAGGKAAERISELEKEREDKIFSGIQDWVKETIPRAGEYRTKATVLRRKIEGQLEQVVEQLAMSIIPVTSQKEKAKEELYQLLQESIIQQSFQELIQFNQTINRRSSNATQNQMIGQF